MVVSSDSGAEIPVQIARDLVRVGLINATTGYPAGALNGSPSTGLGGHWGYQLSPEDFRSAQMPPLRPRLVESARAVRTMIPASKDPGGMAPRTSPVAGMGWCCPFSG